MPEPDLEAQSRQFADEVTSVLNATVTSGTRLSSVLEETTGICHIGWGITKNAIRPAAPFEVGKGFLNVSYRLDLDQDGRLRILTSEVGYYAQGDFDSEPLFRYEYERGKKKYPEAHLHVHAQTGFMAGLRLRGKARLLPHLHFPVGGTRYRPILEDVVEMLIVHGWVKERAGWKEAVEAGRARFYKTQLGAAARADPESAWMGVKDTDWWNENRPDRP